MHSKAATVKEYLASLPADRRVAIEAVRAVILKNLGKGFEEGMQHGGIAYYVPHSLFPAGHHRDPTRPLTFAGLASQKQYMAVHMMCLHFAPAEDKWFRQAWAKTGKKLDMGRCCVRFKTLDHLALGVVGRAVKRVTVKKFLAFYAASLARSAKARKTQRAG